MWFSLQSPGLLIAYFKSKLRKNIGWYLCMTIIKVFFMLTYFLSIKESLERDGYGVTSFTGFLLACLSRLKFFSSPLEITLRGEIWVLRLHMPASALNTLEAELLVNWEPLGKCYFIFWTDFCFQAALLRDYAVVFFVWMQEIWRKQVKTTSSGVYF